ncbi:hypothetical protein HDV01_002269 [Terramyces sp. JEL0728]|nr:hypothetical protein HDV01_002269 [Terramyces sp. JEL0728]
MTCFSWFLQPASVEKSQTASAAKVEKPSTAFTHQSRKIVGPMDNDWLLLAKQILDKDNHFAMMRFADGEQAVIDRQPLVSEQDSWEYKGGEKSMLSTDLAGTLRGHYGQPVYYGLSGDENVASLNSFLSQIEQNLDYITYSNVFVNSNYKRTRNMWKKIQAGEAGPVVIFASKESRANAESFVTLQEYLECPNNGLDWYETHHDEIKKEWTRLAKKYTNTLFIMSCGPLTNIGVHTMWNLNNRNKYIDFGSSVDEVLKGKKTRPYMDDGNFYSNQFDSAFKLDAKGKADMLPGYFY